MGYKMKGSSFYGKKGESPAKQLKAEYMRSPEEKAFYEDYEASKDYKPVEPGSRVKSGLNDDGQFSYKIDDNTIKDIKASLSARSILTKIMKKKMKKEQALTVN